jgi:hypothetical protein
MRRYTVYYSMHWYCHMANEIFLKEVVQTLLYLLSLV